ncbi:conserved hypothetical protein (plasmid) [Borreliella finlandensis]|uniref:Uncharacterized protein n=1 Tax=Borreliella finlandensis TaxID=498741 RepID=A0A826GX07_9SPIR|nr:conserved hypothetical protein [Borreliella finlandensis]
MVAKGKGQGKSLEIDDISQLSLEPEVSSAAPRAKRQARQAEDEQAKDPYLDSGKELDDILLKFKKYAKSMSLIENKVFSSSNGCFQSKNERADAYSFSCLSFTDKIEKYFHDLKNSFPYKRGVKLVPKENSLYVEIGADTDLYGICVDVCEFSCIAYVLPITM